MVEPCSSAEPRIAFCIAGAARSFATPLVLRMLRTHFIDALAGGNLASSRIFLMLKTGDSPKVSSLDLSPCFALARCALAHHCSMGDS